MRAGLLGLCLVFLLRTAAGGAGEPASTWPQGTPESAGLDAKGLRAFQDAVGGRGCVLRGGTLVYSWGDITRRGDVASAAKPVYGYFLLRALAAGRLGSLDDPVLRVEPRLAGLNPGLGNKDDRITWRYLATQTSGYGVTEPPGAAFDYNDRQMALFWDCLFGRVYGARPEDVDRAVLGPGLADPVGCEDAPTMLAFGAADRPGRLAISPRDFARFGLLYLQQGRWQDRQLLDPAEALRAVGSALPNSIPRTAAKPAAMIPGQRSIGSQRLPDDQTDHLGGYSYLWWRNGVGRAGNRLWASAPSDAYGAFGHGGEHAVAVIPSLGLVASWNDARVTDRGAQDRALGLLAKTVTHPPGGEEPAGGALAGERPRLIVSSDIGGGDPDDCQSMVHLLHYADALDVEGLVSSPPGAGRLADVLETLAAYERDYPRLRRRFPAAPSPAALRSAAAQGAVDPAPEAGFSAPTGGSRRIVAAARSADPRPLWLIVWGGLTDVAQAVHDDPSIKPRVRVYSTGAWNTRHDRAARDYLFREHPDLWWIEADTTFRGMYVGGVQEGDLGNRSFPAAHVRGHGELGDLFWAKKPDLKMGDTPTLLYLLRGDPDQPAGPHWGGAFRKADHGPHYWIDDPEPQLAEPAYPGARTVNRWRADTLRDWQGRLSIFAAPASP